MKNELKNDYDSFKDVADFQKNMFNPGHYIGTGRVSPQISAPGNATPLAVIYLIGSCAFLALGVFLLTQLEIVAAIVTLIISFFGMLLALGYIRKAKRYHKSKAALEKEEIDEAVEDKIWQRTCPKCNKNHDIDYPKCPFCDFNYIK